MAGVRRIYGATSLTGTGSGSLADIDVTILKPNDLAVAKANDIPSPANPGHTDQYDAIYFYRFASVGTAEDSPRVIKPNNAGSSGRWLLISPQYFMENIEVEPGKKVIVNEIQGNTTDLLLSYNDGTVYVTIGDNLVTIDAPTTFTDPITSTVATGTAPFTVASSTIVNNLNAQYVSGIPITDISRLSSNTYKYTVLPQVTNATTVVPANDADLVTKKWVDDQLLGGASIDHDTLDHLLAPYDDHTQYIHIDGRRAFTAVVSGVTPSLSAHLSTKGYVDTRETSIRNDMMRKDGTVAFTNPVGGVTPTASTHLVTKGYLEGTTGSFYTGGNISHAALLNKGADDHPQYIRVDATLRTFTAPIGGVTPTASTHLTTKGYVDTITNGIIGDYIKRDGTNAFIGLPSVSVIPTFISAHTGGTGYPVSVTTTNVATTPTYSGGSGLTVDVTANGSGVPTLVVINTPGTGYTVGETITITGSGGGDCTFTITDGDPAITPSESYNLATIDYVNGIALGGGADHGSLLASSLLDDDHPQYMTTNPATSSPVRTFTTVVSGQDPTLAAHLVTRNYIDNITTDGTISHSNLDAASLLVDSHTQYILADSSRAFTNTLGDYPSVTNSAVNPSSPEHLTTKAYVDAGLFGLGGTELVEYVDIYGRHPMIADQGFLPRLITDPLLTDIYSGQRLVTKYYVDTFMGQARVSELDDGVYGYLNAKFQFSDTPPVTNLDMGSATGIRYDTTLESTESIVRALITNGGSGFFVYRPLDFGVGAYTPQTYLDATNGGIFDASGTGGFDLTETFIQPISNTNPGAGDADIRIEYVFGDVEYIEIVDGGTGLTGGDGFYPFTIIGDTPAAQRAVWTAEVVSGTIVGVSRLSLGSGYTNVGVGDITTIPTLGGTFTLRPYVVGEVLNISSYQGSGGDGYTSASYNITSTTVAGFNVSGHGTSGGTDVGALNITFYNPSSQKMKLSQYNPTITASSSFSTYAGGYTRTTGNVISALEFDEWGHITGITEEGTGGASWVNIDNTDNGLELTANINYFADTGTAAFAVDLPATPTQGQQVVIDDYNKNSSTFNITVGRNGSLIEGSATDFTINTDGARVIFTYTDVNADAYGWRYKVI